MRIEVTSERIITGRDGTLSCTRDRQALDVFNVSPGLFLVAVFVFGSVFVFDGPCASARVGRLVIVCSRPLPTVGLPSGQSGRAHIAGSRASRSRPAPSKRKSTDRRPCGLRNRRSRIAEPCNHARFTCGSRISLHVLGAANRLDKTRIKASVPFRGAAGEYLLNSLNFSARTPLRARLLGHDLASVTACGARSSESRAPNHPHDREECLMRLSLFAQGLHLRHG